jgi:holin-like protein
MKIFKESIIIFGIYLISEFLSGFFNLPLPGSILGMVILFVLLCTKIIKLEQVSTVSNFFLDHLAFFFIPAGVGLISAVDVIKDILPQLLIICIVTTIITMAVTGRLVQMLSEKKNKKGKTDDGHPVK